MFFLALKYKMVEMELGTIQQHYSALAKRGALTLLSTVPGNISMRFSSNNKAAFNVDFCYDTDLNSGPQDAKVLALEVAHHNDIHFEQVKLPFTLFLEN